MKSDEELMHIFNKRDLWISGSIISGTLACVIAILIPIVGNNDLLPTNVILIAIAACVMLTIISLARWHSWNKLARNGIGSRDWMRSSM